MKRPRYKPYTKRGIRRIPCPRCGKPSTCQWQVCADNRQYRTCCDACDVELNRLVLRFFRIPNAAAKLAAYKAQE